jgi:hypothetical protein
MPTKPEPTDREPSLLRRVFEGIAQVVAGLTGAYLGLLVAGTIAAPYGKGGDLSGLAALPVFYFMSALLIPFGVIACGVPVILLLRFARRVEPLEKN